MLARSKLNSIKSTISKLLIDNEISHEDFMTVIKDALSGLRQFKNDEKCFLFHLKSSFRSQDT